MQIQYLTNLVFENDDFSHNGLRYSYKSIEGITFTAAHTKHSINFVPLGSSFDANLILHLSDKTIHVTPEKSFLEQSQKIRMEAVWKAKEIFSEITFLQRVKSYENQLTKKEFFSYRGNQFRKGGDVFRDGLWVGNLNEDLSVSLGPFHISFSKTKKSILQKIASALLVDYNWNLDISRDRDCFLHMFRLATQRFWATERYRNI